jgi:hypothetical protein
MSPLKASAKYITTTLISSIIIRLTVIALGIIGAAARSSKWRPLRLCAMRSKAFLVLTVSCQLYHALSYSCYRLLISSISARTDQHTSMNGLHL